MGKDASYVAVECIGCKYRWKVYEGQIAKDDHPVCPKCFMPAIAKRASTQSRGNRG